MIEAVAARDQVTAFVDREVREPRFADRLAEGDGNRTRLPALAGTPVLKFVNGRVALCCSVHLVPGSTGLGDPQCRLVHLMSSGVGASVCAALAAEQDLRLRKAAIGKPGRRLRLHPFLGPGRSRLG
jgi:hypothetical protein